MITHAYAQTVMHRTRGQPWRMLAQLLATSQHPNTCELSTLEHVGCVASHDCGRRVRVCAVRARVCAVCVWSRACARARVRVHACVCARMYIG